MPSGAVVLHDAALEQELTVATRLGEIRVPTLVFDGRHDFCAPPDLGGARFVAAIPSARHVIFENSSHIPYAEEPDRWTDVVREFIRSVCSTAA
jgi:pimeloyl-ACP methyl ester carboxylesterase